MSLQKTIVLSELDETLSIAGLVIDFTPALKIVRQLLISDTKENFRQESAPLGKKWAPLKRRKGKILQDTGALRASIASAFAAGGVDQMTPTSLTWGTNLFYAPFHQYGTRTIPARPFIGLTPRLEDRIDEVVTDHAADKIAAAIGGR